MNNWFPTLNDALDSEGLVDIFPLGANINYGETLRFVKDGTFVTIYRDERGMYERPVHYASKMEDTVWATISDPFFNDIIIGDES